MLEGFKNILPCARDALENDGILKYYNFAITRCLVLYFFCEREMLSGNLNHKFSIIMLLSCFVIGIAFSVLLGKVLERLEKTVANNILLIEQTIVALVFLYLPTTFLARLIGPGQLDDPSNNEIIIFLMVSTILVASALLLFTMWLSRKIARKIIN